MHRRLNWFMYWYGSKAIIIYYIYYIHYYYIYYIYYIHFYIYYIYSENDIS